MPKLYVLLGDVFASRKIKETDAFQRNLNKTMGKLNKQYPADIYAQWKIIKGRDELGAVLTSSAHLHSFLTEFFDLIKPARIRFACVYEDIDTGFTTKDVSQMDGVAFHRAARMIEELKKTKTLLSLSFGDDRRDSLIAALGNSLLLIRSHWTREQLRVVREYEKKESQEVVAKCLGITQQAVSKSLRRTNWKELKNLEKLLSQELEQYDKEVRRHGREA